MQRSLQDFHRHKGQLIAISPLTVKNAISLKEKLALTFTMAVDTANQASRQFGLAYSLAEPVRPVYKGFGINIPEANGDNSFELPIPATYIIDTKGIVMAAHISADHTIRLDPEEIVSALESME